MWGQPRIAVIFIAVTIALIGVRGWLADQPVDASEPTQSVAEHQWPLPAYED